MHPYTPTGDRKGEDKFEFERERLHIGDGDHGEDCACCDREKPTERVRCTSVHSEPYVEQFETRKRFRIAEMNAVYVKALPSYGLVILLGVLLLFGYLTQLIYHDMPTIITEEQAGYTQISEERAWRHLNAIVGDGPRVCGSPYHRQKTEQLKAILDRIAANATQRVRTDWQLATGAYYLQQFRAQYINTYQRVSNIIALLEGESGLNQDGTSNSSILFNCHYDTVPTSPGASDNALFCAAMVEALTVLSQSDHKLKHNIIFLFNGAEESGLQASHGFLQHPWAKGVTGLINLDSAGMNGKAMLFQVTNPHVIDGYSAHVSSPSAQAVGEMLFTSGIVPSDTDFRVFRDFGGMYGVDIAFNRYGHVYHTRFDALSLIDAGVLQHTSNTIYELAKMADKEEFANKPEAIQGTVYYDYLNIFMLNYSNTTATVLDTLIAILALSSVFYYLWIVGMRWRLLKELFLSVLATLSGFFAGCLVVLTLTLIMVATVPQLRYYTNPWMVVPMYWVPFLIAAVSVTHAFDWWRCNKSGLNRSTRTAQAMAANRLIWSLALLFLVLLPITSPMRYVISVPLFLSTLAAFISLTVRRRYRVKAWQHLLMELVFSIPAVLFIFSLCLSMDALMMPIMGRSTTQSPDYMVAAINAVLVVLSCLPLAGIEILFSRRRLWLPEGLVAALAVILMFLPLSSYSNSSPYPAPQRYNVFHTVRIGYSQSGVEISRDSGLWAGHTDVNSPATLLSSADLTARNVKTNFTEDCERYLYCNLPTMTPRSNEFVPFSVWIDFPPPTPFNPTPSLQVVSRSCEQNTCTLNFTATGTPHQSIILWPRAGVTLEDWSLDTDIVNATSKEGRAVYFVYHTICTFEDPLPTFEFSIKLAVASHLNGQTDPLLDAVFNANKNHHESEMTREFSAFVQSLPEWFNVAPYITTRITYII